MRLKTWGVLWICLLFLAPQLTADSIYTWTDEQGVKRYSDQPPADAGDVETIPTVQPPADDAERKAYLDMMRQVERERRQREIEIRREAAARAEQEREKAEAERKAQIEAERQRLQQQIDALNQRALSPFFTQGMRQSQIEAIQKQIDALEGD